MNNFSPNMLKVFEECPMKFFFKYVQKISMPTSSRFFEKGKKIHALANYYLQGLDVEKFETALNFEEKKVWEVLKSNKYLKYEVVNTEYNLSCKVDNYWIGGRLDALVKEGANYFILDYKTGSVPKNPEKDFQTIVYLLAVERFLSKQKIKYDSLKFVYIDLKNNLEHEIELTKERKDIYKKRIVEICENIDFSINTSNFQKEKVTCKFCEYNKICDL